MKVHVWDHPMIKAMAREPFRGDLWGEAGFNPVCNAEIGLGRWGIVVCDLRYIDVKRGSKAVEAIE